MWYACVACADTQHIDLLLVWLADSSESSGSSWVQPVHGIMGGIAHRGSICQLKHQRAIVHAGN